jgi:signal transduction histidine kinase
MPYFLLIGAAPAALAAFAALALLAALAVLAALAASARLFALRREIRRLANALKGGARQLAATAGSAALEELCESVNASIETCRETAIAAQTHEARLRESIANISHDLRTPLTAMLGYLELARANPEKAAEYAAIVEARAGVLRGLVESFYELSMADGENSALPIETIDAAAILAGCLLGSRALFEARGITPAVSVPDAPVLAAGNGLAFERVVQNLIQNALRYAIGEIGVGLAAKGGECVLAISNDAAGISEDDIPRLFDRFYTADKSRSGGSAGVGLCLVKALVGKMGGRVAARLGCGLFVVEVSLQQASAIRSALNEPQQAAASRSKP